jgi:hypothetical protein
VSLAEGYSFPEGSLGFYLATAVMKAEAERDEARATVDRVRAALDTTGDPSITSREVLDDVRRALDPS